jgi:hypothetical protein
MMSNVPQFIDIEDKIVGPLTAKQLGWLALGGIIDFIFFAMLDSFPYIVSTIFIALIFGALAFYKPYNQPLISFLVSGASFIVRPKIYIWKRSYENLSPVKKTTGKIEIIKTHKEFDAEKAKELSKILDLNNLNNALNK